MSNMNDVKEGQDIKDAPDIGETIGKVSKTVDFFDSLYKWASQNYNKYLYRDVDEYVQDKIEFEKSQDKAPFKLEVDYLRYDVRIMNNGGSDEDYNELLRIKKESGDKEFTKKVFELMQYEIGDESSDFTFDDVKSLEGVSNIRYAENNKTAGHTSNVNSEVITYSMFGTGLTFEMTKGRHSMSTEMMEVEGLIADPEFHFEFGAKRYNKKNLKNRFQIDSEKIYSDENYNSLNSVSMMDGIESQHNQLIQTFMGQLGFDLDDNKVDIKDVMLIVHTLPKNYLVGTREMMLEEYMKSENNQERFESNSYLQQFQIEQSEESFENLMKGIARISHGDVKHGDSKKTPGGRDIIFGLLTYIEKSKRNVEGYRLEDNKIENIRDGPTYSEMKDVDLNKQDSNKKKTSEEQGTTQDMNVFDKLKTKSSMFKESEIEASRDRRNAREQIDREFEKKQNRENYKRLNERYASKDWSSSKESTRIEKDKDLSDDLAL